MGYFKQFWQPERKEQPVNLITQEIITEEIREWLRQEKERRDGLRQEKLIRIQLQKEAIEKRKEFERLFRAWVYFIQEPHSGYIKIGVSRRIYLYDRFDELRHRYGKDLLFLGAFEGEYLEERVLHKMFAKFRTSKPRDEWFSPDYPILFTVKHLCNTEYDFYLPKKHELPDPYKILQ